MEKINFEDGTLVSNAKVTIDNVEHEVTPAEYSGNTPLSAYTLNLMQGNIEEEIDALEKIKVSATQPTTGEEVWFRKSKNLFNYKNAVYLNAYINTTTMKIIESTSIKNHQTSYIKCASNTTYTISKSVGKSFRVGTTTDIPAIGVTINSSKANHTGTSLTITTGENDNYLVFTCFSTIDGDIGSYEEMYATVQVEEGLIATAYEPYEVAILIKENDEYLKIQDKEIMDNLSSLNEDVTNLIAKENFTLQSNRATNSWDDILIQGYSSITRIIGGIPLGKGAPTGAYDYGVLITINPSHSKEVAYNTVQIYITDDPANISAGNHNIYIRTRNFSWFRISGAAVNAVT